MVLFVEIFVCMISNDTVLHESEWLSIVWVAQAFEHPMAVTQLSVLSCMNSITLSISRLDLSILEKGEINFLFFPQAYTVVLF